MRWDKVSVSACRLIVWYRGGDGVAAHTPAVALVSAEAWRTSEGQGWVEHDEPQG